MLRPFNPVDIFGLLLLQARTEPNMAWVRQGLTSGRARSVPLGGLVGEWLPRRAGRHTWVLSERGLAIGVVSIRRRRGQGNWEVDRLLVARGKEQAALEVLEGLNVPSGRFGAERLFLRLPEKSPIETHVTNAGFRPLLREELLVRSPGKAPDGAQTQVGSVRPLVDADAFNLFRLYSCTVPGPLRQVEGVTLREWRGSRDMSQGLPPREAWVAERDAEIVAAITLSENGGGTRMIDLLARPGQRDAAAALLDTAVTTRRHRGTLLCLLPEYQCDLAGLLGDVGFESRGLFRVYVKYVIARVRQPGLLPVGA